MNSTEILLKIKHILSNVKKIINKKQKIPYQTNNILKNIPIVKEKVKKKLETTKNCYEIHNKISEKTSKTKKTQTKKIEQFKKKFNKDPNILILQNKFNAILKKNHEL
ncbi:hypothetical protein HIC20_00905 [Buchnera aphidicola (Hormaphis cornu)]|nr:hypothetical protein HIC20_00905 [Buchnera aphidicola (Hormaphis cornu)]